MNKKIEGLIDEIVPDVIKWRRQIHQHPEMALKEVETSSLVRSVLADAGVTLKPPFLETDVVAITGDESGKNVTLRADMDALPLQEQTGLDYASVNKGIMHACGHDGHTAMLMGAAVVLAKIADELPGSVRFVFQPGEEVTAAGRDLVAGGALLNPEPAAVMAIHGWPGIPVGVIASRKGDIFAASDMFEITVKGYGAHGSTPDKSIDALLIGAHIVEALQGIAAREISPHDTFVLSVCKFQAGHNFNVISEKAVIAGTTRYYNPEVGKKARKRIEEIASGICTAMGAKCDFMYDDPYIPMRNNDEIVDLGEKVVKDTLGSDSWLEFPVPSMGGEDFSFYVQDYPGAMFALGMGEDSYGLHNPQYNFNDDAIKAGITFLVSFALSALEKAGGGV